MSCSYIIYTYFGINVPSMVNKIRKWRDTPLFKNGKGALYEKRPNTDFFLVLMRENTDQKKLRIWTFHAVDED